MVLQDAAHYAQDGGRLVAHRVEALRDAVGDQRSFVMLGTPNCGKGQPDQVAHTGHGTAPARFRNVRTVGRLVNQGIFSGVCTTP